MVVAERVADLLPANNSPASAKMGALERITSPDSFSAKWPVWGLAMTFDIIRAFHDPNLLGAGIRDYSTFKAWETALRAIFGLGFVSDEQRAIYRRCTNRTDTPTPCREAILLCGRRSGKCFMMALCAVWLALFRFGGKKPYLQRGEVLTIKVIAQDRDAARTIMGYVDGLLSVPLFKQKVKKQTAAAFELADNVRIEVVTCDYRAVRSYTCGAALCDEACFWSNDNGVNPAEAILAALKPCMMTVPNSLLLIGSSPWARRGAVYDRYDRWFGVANEHTLVWQAPTLDMNPSIDPAEVELEYALDPANAAAEYGAQFRTDVEALLSREVIEAATINGRFELPYDPMKNYFAAIDASGGSSELIHARYRACRRRSRHPRSCARSPPQVQPRRRLRRIFRHHESVWRRQVFRRSLWPRMGC